MSYDFFLPLLSYPDPTSSEGLLRALDLAAALGGEVTALVHEADIPPVTNVLAEVVINTSQLADVAEAASALACDRLIREMTNAARGLALPVKVQQLRVRIEFAPSLVAAAARTHDISLVVSDGSDGTRAIAEALLFESGGPLIVFPTTETPTHVQSVLIAWDGGRAAARALRDALPILRQAKRVGLLTVVDDKTVPTQSVTDVQRFLAFHGIDTQLLERRRGIVAVGKFIEDTALSQDAGLVVMGAYGHTRLRELVLGGATRSMLEGVKLPTLLSH